CEQMFINVPRESSGVLRLWMAGARNRGARGWAMAAMMGDCSGISRAGPAFDCWRGPGGEAGSGEQQLGGMLVGDEAVDQAPGQRGADGGGLGGAHGEADDQPLFARGNGSGGDALIGEPIDEASGGVEGPAANLAH